LKKVPNKVGKQGQRAYLSNIDKAGGLAP
jgi:hypothetical protein